MSTQTLPAQPSLSHLKYQAQDLLKGRNALDSGALARIRGSHPRFAQHTDANTAASAFTLADAQLVIAREYGFASWSKLKGHVERMAIPSDFREAIVLGDLERVKRYVSKHLALADIVLPDEQHAQVGGGTEPTPLHLAIVQGHIEMVHYLVDAGADVNKKDSRRSSVHLAIEHCPALIDFLLEHGAQMDIGMAANLGRFDELRAMLTRDPLLATDRSTGSSALEWAAWGGQVEAARLLLDHGAQVQGECGPAIRVNAIEVLGLLLDTVPDSSSLINQQRLLHLAVRMANTHDNLPIIQTLIDRGANVSAIDDEGNTPLKIALTLREDPKDPYGHEPPQVVAQWLDGAIDLLRRHDTEVM